MKVSLVRVISYVLHIISADSIVNEERTKSMEKPSVSRLLNQAMRPQSSRQAPYLGAVFGQG